MKLKIVSCIRLFLFLRKGSGALENYEKAEQDYIAGMKYKDMNILLSASKAGLM